MESKIISVRVSDATLNKLDAFADKRYPNVKGNRTAVVLDAIDLLLAQPENTSSYDVYKRIGKLEKQVIAMLEALSKEGINIDKNTLSYDVNEELEAVSYDNVNTLTIDEALELSRSRGFKGTRKTFLNNFTKNKHKLNYSFRGIKRIPPIKGKPSLFYDVQT